MWIRSVLKEALVDASSVVVKFNGEGGSYDVFADDVRVAKYSSKAMAIEVVDEIQSFLEKTYIQPENLIENNAWKCIYQMPKEDRVNHVLIK